MSVIYFLDLGHTTFCGRPPQPPLFIQSINIYKRSVQRNITIYYIYMEHQLTYVSRPNGQFEMRIRVEVLECLFFLFAAL